MADLFTVEADTQALWHFEETTGDYLDETANNNDSDALQITDREAAGRWGYCPEFDGVDDYIDFGAVGGANEIKTAEFWLYLNSDTEDIMDFDGGTHTIEVSGGTLSATGFDTPTIYVDGVATTSIGTGAWHYVAVTTDTGFTASALKIGKETTYLDGFIDEVRISNTAHTAAKIMSDYIAGGFMGANF